MKNKNKPKVYRSFADLKEISTVSPGHKAQIAAMEREFDDLIENPKRVSSVAKNRNYSF